MDFLLNYIKIKLMSQKKGSFEISQLAGWVLIILAIVAMLFLIRSWASRGQSMNPFRK